MIESIITILFIGLLTGFVFSMPIAGPISIIITSNALKGNFKFCIRTALGASIIEAIYVLISVLGLSALVSVYSSLIPYMLMVASFFIIFVGLKIARSRIELNQLESTKLSNGELEKKGGLRTGLFLNLTNPSFFFGVLATSFLVLSFASSIGLNTGGLDLLVQENITSLKEIGGEELPNIDSTFVSGEVDIKPDEHSSYTLILSTLYAISLSSGSFVWLFLLSKMLVKYRRKIKVEILNWIIKLLGLILCGIGIFLLWKSYDIFMG